MKNILHNTLNSLEGYLISIQRNTETSQYELEVGIRNTWVYKSTSDIDTTVILETEEGNIIRIFGRHNKVVIDDLVDFLKRVILTNRKISEMEEDFQKELQQQKERIQKQILEFQDQLEKVKEESFNLEDDEDTSTKEVLSDTKKNELEEKIA